MDRELTYRDRYLDLLEKALTFSLWPEPPRPIECSGDRSWKWRAARFVDRLLQRTVGARVAISRQINREVGEDWPALAHTMVGRKRLRNVRELCETVESYGIPGAFIECGVWRGGCSIFARACLDERRPVICCDSFNGLPFDPSEPEWCAFDFLRVPVYEVRKNFEAYGLACNVRFVPGLFSETLPTIREPIAILRCDGDMYSSTITILANLYHHVSPGGFVIIDDWNLPNCRRAVEDFRRLDKEAATIVDIDGVAVFWRKEGVSV